MIEGGGLGGSSPTRSARWRCRPSNGVDRRRGRRRGRGGRASTRRLLAYFQGPRRAGEEPDQTRLRELVPERRRRAYELRAVIETLADAARSPSCARLRARDGHGAGPDRGPPARHRSPTTPATWPARSPATAPTRRRASCSSATPSGCRRVAGRHPGDDGRARRRGDGAGAPQLAPVRHRRGAAGAVRRGRSCVAATASAPRRWSAAACTSRCSPSPGRPPSSARWGSRGRSGWRCAGSSRRSPTRRSASSAFAT